MEQILNFDNFFKNYFNTPFSTLSYACGKKNVNKNNIGSHGK